MVGDDGEMAGGGWWIVMGGGGVAVVVRSGEMVVDGVCQKARRLRTRPLSFVQVAKECTCRTDVAVVLARPRDKWCLSATATHKKLLDFILGCVRSHGTTLAYNRGETQTHDHCRGQRRSRAPRAAPPRSEAPRKRERREDPEMPRFRLAPNRK